MVFFWQLNTIGAKLSFFVLLYNIKVTRTLDKLFLKYANEKGFSLYPARPEGFFIFDEKLSRRIVS